MAFWNVIDSFFLLTGWDLEASPEIGKENVTMGPSDTSSVNTTVFAMMEIFVDLNNYMKLHMFTYKLPHNMGIQYSVFLQ